MRWFLWLPVLAACESGSLQPKLDGDTDSDGIEVPTEDSDIPLVDRLAVTVRYDGPIKSSWKVGAMLGHADADGLTFAGQVASQPVTSFPTRVDLPIHADGVDDLGDGTPGAYLYVFAWDDADGDGLHDKGEHVVAVSRSVVLFVEEEQDWYLLNWLPYTQYLDISLGLDLVSTEGSPDVTVTGTVVPPAPQERNHPDRIGTFTEQELFVTWEPGPGTRVADATLGSPFGFHITGAPPVQRQSHDQGYTWYVGYVSGYVDDDASGDFTAGDTPAGDLCNGDQPVYAYWTPPMTDFEIAYYYVLYDSYSGWSLYSYDADTYDSKLVLPTDALTVSTSDCPWY